MPWPRGRTPTFINTKTDVFIRPAWEKKDCIVCLYKLSGCVCLQILGVCSAKRDEQGLKTVFPHCRNILFQKAGDKKENKASRVRNLLLLSEPQSDYVFVTV